MSAKVQGLLQDLQDAHASVRWRAAIDLARLDPTGAVVPALVECLGKADLEVRRLLVMVLGNFAAAGWPAVPALVDALDDADTRVRCRAATALGKTGVPAALPALSKAKGDANGCVRKAAAQAVAQLRKMLKANAA